MQGFGLIEGFEMSMITDEMLYAQNGREYLWRLSPQEEENKRLGNLYSTYLSAVKMYGENSSDAKEAYDNLPEEAKTWRKEFRRCVKPPREVWAYEFMIHLSKGSLTPEALDLISIKLNQNKDDNT